MTRACALLLATLVAACASPLSLDGPRGSASLPSRALLHDVPFFAQSEQLCGPASLAMALAASGKPVSPEALAAVTYTPGRGGTLAVDLVTATRRNGRLAYPVHDLEELLGEIAAGRPVLVLQNLAFSWLPTWHYAVVVGFDLLAGTITLHTGTREARPMRIATFERTWRRAERFGLVVLPPDELPAAVPESAVLAAIAAHEQAWPAAAERAYRAATERYDSAAAWIGLGNARVAGGDLPGAEAALRTATTRHPQAADAFNNLAHVLHAQGRRTEAGLAIGRAIELGGPNEGFYRQTLEELERSRESGRGR